MRRRLPQRAAEMEQVLVVRVGERRVAMPLASVARLEHLRIEHLELVGRPRGRAATAVRSFRSRASDRLLGSYSEPSANGELLVVVFTRGERSAGLVVDQILDIVDDEVAQHSDIEDHGLLGSTVLGDRVTELLERPRGDPAGRRLVLRHRPRHDRRPSRVRPGRSTAMSQYVTFTLDGRLYGIDVVRVQEALRSHSRTRVPLAPPTIAGLVNLRGQVVLTIDLRTRLGPARPRRARRADDGRRAGGRRGREPAGRRDR